MEHPLFCLFTDEDAKRFDNAGLLLANGVVAASEDLRDLRILQTGQPQLKEIALVGFELAHEKAHELMVVSRDGRLFRGRSGVSHVEGAIKRLERVASLVPVAISHHVAGDRKEPAPESAVMAARLKAGEIGQRSHEDLAGCIFCLPPVTKPVKTKAEHSVEIPVVQGFECLYVPLGSENKQRVGARQSRLPLRDCLRN
jgi:hypothetical protein